MNTWSLSWHGLTTVVGLEIRQRVRSRRWIWALIAWFVFIGAVTALVLWSVYKIYRYDCNPLYDTCSIANSDAGPTAFAVITMFILGMGLVIAPAFTATSINGDRTQGTLATLQATRLSSVEIAGGKLIAAWLSAAVFLLVALPFIIVSMVLGNISVLQVVVCFAVIFVLVAVVCAIGLGWSSIVSRAAGSTLLTYLSVVVLGIISPLVLVLTLSFVQEDTQIQVWGLNSSETTQYYDAVNAYWNNPKGKTAPEPPVDQCHWFTRTQSVTRMDRVWWLLVPNPFVIVADAAPLSPQAHGDITYAEDPLSMIRSGVREMARPPALEVDQCIDLYASSPAYQVNYNTDGTVTITKNGSIVTPPPSPVTPRPVAENYPVWPYGLAVNLILGAIFFWITVHKLRIPYKTLTKGTRVA